MWGGVMFSHVYEPAWLSSNNVCELIRFPSHRIDPKQGTPKWHTYPITVKKTQNLSKTCFKYLGWSS